MTHHSRNPPQGDAAGLLEDRPCWNGDEPRDNPSPSKQQAPSDQARLDGSLLAWSDAEEYCREAGKLFNCTANDIQNLDQDMAFKEFFRAVSYAKAAAALIVELRGRPS